MGYNATYLFEGKYDERLWPMSSESFWTTLKFLAKHNREDANLAWETVKKTGYLLEKNNLVKGKGMINSRKFLCNMTRAFATTCVDYFNVTGELPFIYHERQIHSALMPSIAKVADAAFMEQPVTRKKQKVLQVMAGLIIG